MPEAAAAAGPPTPEIEAPAALPAAIAYRPWQLPLFLALVWLVHVTVQFDKPVHIDDTHYVYAARHLIAEPWRPLGNEINWTLAPVPAYRDLINPPAYMYLQAGWIALFGDSIRGLHLLASFSVVLAAVSAFVVARRFTRHPMLASALVMASPNVLPVTNLMVDVPALAISLAAVAVFLSAVDGGRRGRAAAGGALVGLALLTKYNTVILVPLLICYALLRGRARYAMFMAMPAAMLALWSLHNILVYGEVHVLFAGSFEPYERTLLKWWENAYSAALVPGSTFLFLGVLFLGRARIPGLRAWGLLAAVLLLGPAQLAKWNEPTYSVRLEYWVFATNSLLLLMLAAGGSGATGEAATLPRPGLAKRLGRLLRKPLSGAETARRDHLFLWLWVGAVVLFHLKFAHHQAPRYHILAFPPVAMLLVRAFDNAVPRWKPHHRALAWGSVALELTVALFLAAADDAHARSNRDFPAYVARQHAAGNGRIFCVGHWGLQYYCEEQGLTALDAIHTEVREGDLFIVPQNGSPNLPRVFQPLSAGGQKVCRAPRDGAQRPQGPRPLLELVGELSYPQDLPILPASPRGIFPGTRLLGALYEIWPFSAMERRNNISLYATRVPQVPYSWRAAQRGPLHAERFELWRARCDQPLATESLHLDLGNWSSRMYLTSGWGGIEQEGDHRGIWSAAATSEMRAALDHRRRDYLLRVSGQSVRRPGGLPLPVEVEVSGRRVGELVFTPQRGTRELVVPADALPEWIIEIVFSYSYLRPTIQGPSPAVFYDTIELLPLASSAERSAEGR